MSIALAVPCWAVSCQPDATLPSFDADAEVYIEAICSDRVDKCTECAPVPDSWQGSCDYDACVDAAEGTLADDVACFEELKEFSRCRLERLACNEYYVMDIDTSPGSTCYSEYLAFGPCNAEAQAK